MKLYSCLIILVSIIIAVKADIKTDEDAENEYISYNKNKSVISLMKEYPGDFGSDLF